MRKIVHTLLAFVLLFSGIFISCENNFSSISESDTEYTKSGNGYFFQIEFEGSVSRTINPTIDLNYFDTITIDCSGPGLDGSDKHINEEISSKENSIFIEGTGTWTFNLTCEKGATVFISDTKTIALDKLPILSDNKGYSNSILSFTLEKQSFVLSEDGTGDLYLKFTKKQNQMFYSRAIRMSLLDLDTELPIKGYNNIWIGSSYFSRLPVGSYMLVYQVCNATDNPKALVHVENPVVLEEGFEIVNIDKNAKSSKTYVLDLPSPKKSAVALKSPDYVYSRIKDKNWTYNYFDKKTNLEGATAEVTYTYKDEYGKSVDTKFEVPFGNDIEYDVDDEITALLEYSFLDYSFYNIHESFNVQLPIKFKPQEEEDVVDLVVNAKQTFDEKTMPQKDMIEVGAKFRSIRRDGKETFAYRILDPSEYNFELTKYRPRNYYFNCSMNNCSKDVSFDIKRTNNYYGYFSSPYILKSGKPYVEDIEDRYLTVEDFPELELPEELNGKYTFLGWRAQVYNQKKLKFEPRGWIYFSNCENTTGTTTPMICKQYRLSELSDLYIYPVWIANTYINIKNVTDLSGNNYGTVSVPYGKRVWEAFPKLPDEENKFFYAWRVLLPFALIKDGEVRGDFNITKYIAYRELKYNALENEIYVHTSLLSEIGLIEDITSKLFDKDIGYHYDTEGSERRSDFYLLNKFDRSKIPFEVDAKDEITCQCKDYWIYETPVDVEGGTYTDSKGIKHQISSFKIGKTEISEATHTSYQSLYWNSNYKKPGYVDPVITEDMYKLPYVSTAESVRNLVDSLNYFSSGRFRNPTMEEFHWAASGGTKSKGYTYAGSNSLADVHISKNHIMAQTKPNELGLYDMTGNEWEYLGITKFLPYEYNVDGEKFIVDKRYDFFVGGDAEVGYELVTFSFGKHLCGGRLAFNY